jgi:hypothetical protein
MAKDKRIGFLQALRIATTPPPRRDTVRVVRSGSRYGARFTEYATSRGGASYDVPRR